MRNVTANIVLIVLSAAAAVGCRGEMSTVLEQLTNARQMSADLLVQFTKAADATNRAVMADTDQASTAFAHEAGEATAAVQKDVDALRPVLKSLGYTNETGLLNEFVSRFAEYRALDRRILDLAVENTNLKAQTLSFGPAQQAADAFRDSLKALESGGGAKDPWQAQALVATAVAAVREIQVLQAPHIANADEAVMAQVEKRMATAERTARTALETLATVVAPASRPRVAAATASLDQFMSLNAQITSLSRRNTNVHSLSLALGQKRTLSATCEESLTALRDALARRGFSATR